MIPSRNPGGLLDQGIRVADDSSPRALVKTVGKGGRVMDEARRTARGTWLGFLLIVLVDGATASAAEIVAGRCRPRPAGLGTRPSRGSVQTLIDLDGCGPAKD